MTVQPPVVKVRVSRCFMNCRDSLIAHAPLLIADGDSEPPTCLLPQVLSLCVSYSFVSALRSLCEAELMKQDETELKESSAPHVS